MGFPLLDSFSHFLPVIVAIVGAHDACKRAGNVVEQALNDGDLDAERGES